MQLLGSVKLIILRRRSLFEIRRLVLANPTDWINQARLGRGRWDSEKLHPEAECPLSTHNGH